VIVIDIEELRRLVKGSKQDEQDGGLIVYFGGIEPSRVARTELALNGSDGTKIILDRDREGNICRVEFH
jgi:hypothetical protein